MASTLVLNELRIEGYRVIDVTLNQIMAAWVPGHQYTMDFHIQHTQRNKNIWFAHVELRIECKVPGVEFRAPNPPSLMGPGPIYQSQRVLIRNGESQQYTLAIRYSDSQVRSVGDDFDIGLYALRYAPSVAWKKFGPV